MLIVFFFLGIVLCLGSYAIENAAGSISLNLAGYIILIALASSRVFGC